MARKIKLKTEDFDVGDAISSGCSDIEELGGEMREWYDNMSENLKGGDKGTAVDEAASALEEPNEPSIPQCLIDSSTRCNVTTSHKGGRKGNPRWMRRDNAVSALEAAKAAAEEWLEKFQVVEKEGQREGLEDEELFAASECTQEHADEVQQLIDDLETIIDGVSDVEFPGMYG